MRTRRRQLHGGFKAINKHLSNDLQAVVDGYCKLWVKYQISNNSIDSPSKKC